MKPKYWKTTLEDIRISIEGVKRGRAQVLCNSPGGREIYLVSYADPGRRGRGQANYSSACGGYELDCYKHEKRPAVMLIGAVHGNEPEGIAAILNIISIFETGVMPDGTKNEYIGGDCPDIDIYMIPCANPDGRARVPFDSFVGADFETFRYYSQGTWKDKTLCSWPDCKKVHPIKDSCDFLGGYFDDNGVNIMHDSFFNPMSDTTARILECAERLAPDIVIQFHGGDNCNPHMILPAYASGASRAVLNKLALRVQRVCAKAGIAYDIYPTDRLEENSPPPSFNLASAIHHACGAASAVHECNQGIADRDNASDYDKIFTEHMILVSELLKFCKEEKVNEW